MKTLKCIAIGIFISISSITTAQVSVNVNIGSPPLWGPVGYTDVRYYYLPDVETYYDIQTSMFIYFGNGIWVHSAHLPYGYRNYDLFGGYKYVMTDYRGNEPFVYFKEHKRNYGKGYRNGNQKTIGTKPGKGNSRGNVSNGNNKNSGNSNRNVNKSGGNNNLKGNQNSKGGNSGGGSKGNGGGGGHKGGGGKGK